MDITNEFAVMEINTREGVEQLVTVLTENGYKVVVTPVYETPEELKDRGVRPHYVSHPRITHSLVKIIGKVTKPKYTE